MSERTTLTTADGMPVGDNQNSLVEQKKVETACRFRVTFSGGPLTA
jgi:hypothetical protein